MGERRRLLMGQGGDGGSLSDYVQDGLVVLLDGIKKGGTPDAWTNLIDDASNGYIFLNSGAVSIDNGWEFDGSNQLTCRTANVRYGCKSSTIEFVADVKNAQGERSVVFKGAGIGSTLPTIGEGSSEAIGFYKTNDMLVGVYGSHIKGYKNTTRKGTWSCSGIVGIENGVAMVGGINDGFTGDYNMFRICEGVTGTIHSIRIYSRQLSVEEVLQNQKVDNIRFNLGLNI